MRIRSGPDAAPVSGNPAPDSLCPAIHGRSAFSVSHRRPFRKSESILLSQSAAMSGDAIGAHRSFLISVIVIDRFHMCDEIRAETETSGTYLLERDLIPIEYRNRGASLECFRSTIHIEVVWANVDFA